MPACFYIGIYTSVMLKNIDKKMLTIDKKLHPRSPSTPALLAGGEGWGGED
jgi:hypothetical protein